MKKLLLPIAVIIAIGVLFSSCGTLFTAGGSDYRNAVSAHQRNDYVSAIRSLEQALEVNPTFSEALELYPVVFNEAHTFYKQVIRDHESGEDRHSADQVYSAYSHLHDIHTLAQRGGHGIVSTENYSSQLQRAAAAAGQKWFEWGRSLYDQGGRDRMKQAVNAFETAKARDSQIEDIDQWIKHAEEQATLTLMVLGIGPDEAFHTMVLNDIKKTFSSDRFVQVIETESFRDTGAMVGPIDLAIQYGKVNNIDYLIEIMVNNRVNTTSDVQPVRLPSSQPLFDGTKRTLGYSVSNLVTYRLFALDEVKVIAGNTFTMEDGPYTFEYSIVGAEGMEELYFDDTGKKNLRYVTSTEDLMDVMPGAIRRLRRDISNRHIPPEVTDPTHQSLWAEYFLNRYRNFNDFSRHESGQEFFYGIEVILIDNTDYYYFITGGTDMREAVQEAATISGIINGLYSAGRTFAEQEKDKRGTSYYTIGEEVGKKIKSVL